MKLPPVPRWWAWFPLLPLSAWLVTNADRFGFLTDDAYISFVFSRNWAELGEPVFNPGDRTEGYTNFLWMALLALGRWLGVPSEQSAPVLGPLFGMLGLALAFAWGRWLLGAARAWPWAWVPPTLLASSAGYACWSSGGLETQLFSALLLAALYAYGSASERNQGGAWVGTLAALAAMTRPEGLLLPAGIAAHHGLLVALRQRSWRPPRWGWWLLAAFLALWGPWFAWRWWYYGHPFPNTYYVKAGDGADPTYHAKLWANGLYYLKTWVAQWNVLPALPLSLWGWWGAGSRARRAGLLVVPLGALYLLYAAKVGGDFMGLHRFVLPVAVWVAVGVGLGLSALWARLERPAARAGVVALALGLVAASAVTQERLIETSTAPNNLKSDRGMDTPAYLKRYAQERGAIGEMLAPCLREDDFSIVGGVGAQPYYGRMKAIDVFGLVSEDIAHNVKPTSTRAGHNKHAPDALLEKYKPTFLFSCYAIHKRPNPKVRLTCNDGWWAKRGYERVTLKVPGLERSGPYYTFLARKERAFRCEAGGG